MPVGVCFPYIVICEKQTVFVTKTAEKTSDSEVLSTLETNIVQNIQTYKHPSGQAGVCFPYRKLVLQNIQTYKHLSGRHVFVFLIGSRFCKTYKHTNTRRTVNIWYGNTHLLTMKIHYVSQVPGIGKTHWAIRRIAQLCARKNSICFYVAPTHELLEQVKANLQEELDAFNVQNSLIVISSQTADGLTIGQAASHVLGQSPVSSIRAAKKGDVIFMTHEGFYRVDGSTFTDCGKHSIVFFDEAKREVTSGTALFLSEARLRRFQRFFLRGDRVGSYYRGMPLASTTFEDIEPELNTFLATIPSPRTRANVISILQDIYNSRLSVYLTSKGKRFYSVSTPTHVFSQMKRVYIMSAYFENSQMYHLLKDRGFQLVDYTMKVPGVKSRLKALRARYKKATILPLTNNETVLTKDQLSSLIVPVDQVAHVRDLLSVHGITKRDLAIITKARTGRRLDFDEKYPHAKLVQRLQDMGCSFAPIDYYLGLAKKAVSRWKHRTPGQPLLVFANSVYERRIDRTPGLESCSVAVRGINKYKERHAVAFIAAINPEAQHRNLLEALLPPDYDVNRDFVVDVCLQAINRCSLRSAESDHPVLIIVPDLQLAQYVKEGLHGLPKIAKPLDSKYANPSLHRTVNGKGARRAASLGSLLSQVRLYRLKIKKTSSLEEKEVLERKLELLQARIEKFPAEALTLTKRLESLRTLLRRHRAKGSEDRIPELEAEIQQVQTRLTELGA